jgi:hypothetical protein
MTRSLGSVSVAREVLRSLGISSVVFVATLVAILAADSTKIASGWWVALIAPAAISAIAIPARLLTRTWAVIDTGQWLIPINGSAFRPLAEIRCAHANTFRGVSTLTLGFNDREKFAVSAFTPWFTKKSDRELVKYLLPYTCIPHDATRNLRDQLSR